jgi:PAS domain S-box-containing protein
MLTRMNNKTHNETLTAQAEELEAQAEELTVTNEELRLQTEQLRESQDRLRAALAEAEAGRLRLEAVMEALPMGMAILDDKGGDVDANAAFEEIWEETLRRLNAALEQRVAECTRELRESEALLRAITDNSPDAIYVKDSQSRWLMANPAVLRVVGRSEQEALGKTDRELYADSKTGRAILENDRHLLEGGEPRTFEEVVDTPDGRRVFLSTQAPQRDAHGRIVGLVGISHDITERKKNEETLLKSEERFRLLAETASRLLSAERPQEVVNDLCRKAMTHLNCEAFFNFLVDEQAGRLHLNACAGIPRKEDRKIEWMEGAIADCGFARQRKSAIRNRQSAIKAGFVRHPVLRLSPAGGTGQSAGHAVVRRQDPNAIQRG